MVANANSEYKVFKYYEGMCSSSDFPKEIAKILALGVKSKAVKDIDGNVLEEPFILRSKNWDIVYPAPDSSLNLDLDNLTTDEYRAKIENQVSKISDTVILRTDTTPKEFDESEVDDLSVDADSNIKSRRMYLEIYKPTYIANPEEYPLDCERNGITPKVITKSMYEESFKTSHAVEDLLYTKVTPTLSDDTSIGSLELNAEQTEAYVAQIQNVYGNTSAFSTPITDGATTSITINSDYLSKIKQSQADLYNMIICTLNNGEGIEPKIYSMLESLTVSIVKDGSVYTIMLESLRKLHTYQINARTTISVDHTPNEKLIPEFYLDGIYIPLDTTKYIVDGKDITFIEPVTFESSTDGLLVVRYEYSTKENSLITKRDTLLNNHYVLMRLFDNINEANDGPAENIYNASGDIIQTNSHISPWSKLSWYRDFEEVLIDTLDDDISINQIQNGTVFLPLETAGLNADTKIRYWINTNNDRFSLIVMGNPSLDYEKERHLISACYCGRIDSFDNSINDVAGNFALFTSSSTEPCNTVLKVEKREHKITDFVLSDEEAINGTYDASALDEFIKSSNDAQTCKLVGDCTPNTGGQYNIVLSDKLYFNREEWPKYIIIDKATGQPKTGLTQAFKRNFIMENGKASTLILTVQADHVNFDNDCSIYVAFSSYEEKFQITSGVSRDIFGNVVDVDKVKDYGNNTSDGVTSIMMYHTRSKAYYQKHHMMFATTEEYMSKVMYGKSSYTGEYYADRIKVTHGNDGPRGTLSDLLVIDSSSLYALDELVINKDFEKNPDECEETFVYFPITAPYSPLSDSPNARYGLAIKKQELEPIYEDETKILKIAVDELQQLTKEAWYPTTKNIIPRETTSNGCSVYWKILDGTNDTENTAWIGDENTSSDYIPVKLSVINTSVYKGDTTNLIFPEELLTINSGSQVADKTNSYVTLNNFTPNDGDIVMYGICTEEEAEELRKGLGTGAQIKVIMYDGCTDAAYISEKFEYGIYGVPSTATINKTDLDGATDIKIEDAAPDKVLIIYSVKQETVDDVEKNTITKYDLVALKKDSGDKNALLQYPCSIIANIDSGDGAIGFESNALQKVVSESIDYDSTVNIVFVPEIGYTLDKVIVTNPENTDADEILTSTDFVTIGSHQGITLSNVHHDYRIKVQFVKS